LEYVLTIIAVIVASAAAVWGEMILAKKDSPFLGLTIPCGTFVVNILTFLIMLIAKASLKAILLVFVAMYLVVIAGVIAYLIFRVQHLGRVADDTRRRNRALAARRAEAEKQKRLLELLKGFVCPESTINPEGQREIVLLAKSGHDVTEIAEKAEAEPEEIEAILLSFKRYSSRITSDDGASDIILSSAQQEEILSNVINSLPADHDINQEEFWTKTSVRSLASSIIGTSVSSRIIGAYLRHWEICVPANKTIKARRENPIVANWLAGEFEEIRSKCMAESGELVWIYTVKPEAVHDISSNIPKDVILMIAVTNDGFSKFRIFPADQSDIFATFIDALLKDTNCKYFAVVNDDYDDYMKDLGRSKLRLLTPQIEFFKAK
jgi:hypothetical protein